MTLRYFRAADGAYLGAFTDSPPAGAIQVPGPPQDARATWNGTAWAEPTPEPHLVPLAVVLHRLILTGRLDAMLTVLQAQPAARAQLLAIREGIYATDAMARALLAVAGADPDVILAP